MAGLLAVLVAAVLLPVTATGASAAAEVAPRRDDWLATLNAYRATAGQDPVTEDRSLSVAAALHALYTTATGLIGHTQDPKHAAYSADGAASAARSNVAGQGGNADARSFLDLWMAGPFHAVGMLDPRLSRAGFGQHHRPGAPRGMSSAAVLDVLGGLRNGERIDPFTWPANGASIPLTRYPGGEWPDPLSPCPGYRSGSGVPLLGVFGRGASGASASLTSAGAPVAHCTYDAATYRNPDASTQRYARDLLAARGVVVVVPAEPLRAGRSYTLRITAGSRSITSTFTVSSGGFVAANGASTRAAELSRPVPPTRDAARACPARSVPSAGFRDVGSSSAAGRAIDCLAWWQVTRGTTPTRFEPGGTVTRGQMAAFVARAIRRSGGSLPTNARTPSATTTAARSKPTSTRSRPLGSWAATAGHGGGSTGRPTRSSATR